MVIYYLKKINLIEGQTDMQKTLHNNSHGHNNYKLYTKP